LSGTMKLMLLASLADLLWCTVLPGAAGAADVTSAREAGKRIAAGQAHALALNWDGTVAGLGS